MKSIYMKNSICCLSILILGNLMACNGIGELEEDEQAKLESIDTNARHIDQVPERPVNIDSILAVEAEQKEQERAARLALALETVKTLKVAYDGSTEETENYVESIPLTTFLGKKVEFGALETIQFGEQYTRVYADYFDGEPIGGKLFWIQNSALVAVEIIQLREKITENGAFIEEESTHILYYHDEKLLSIIDLSTNKALEANSVAWLDENLADWSLVKAHISTL